MEVSDRFDEIENGLENETGLRFLFRGFSFFLLLLLLLLLLLIIIIIIIIIIISRIQSSQLREEPPGVS